MQKNPVYIDIDCTGQDEKMSIYNCQVKHCVVLKASLHCDLTLTCTVSSWRASFWTPATTTTTTTRVCAAWICRGALMWGVPVEPTQTLPHNSLHTFKLQKIQTQNFLVSRGSPQHWFHKLQEGVPVPSSRLVLAIYIWFSEVKCQRLLHVIYRYSLKTLNTSTPWYGAMFDSLIGRGREEAAESYHTASTHFVWNIMKIFRFIYGRCGVVEGPGGGGRTIQPNAMKTTFIYTFIAF